MLSFTIFVLLDEQSLLHTWALLVRDKGHLLPLKCFPLFILCIQRYRTLLFFYLYCLGFMQSPFSKHFYKKSVTYLKNCSGAKQLTARGKIFPRKHAHGHFYQKGTALLFNNSSAHDNLFLIQKILNKTTTLGHHIFRPFTCRPLNLLCLSVINIDSVQVNSVSGYPGESLLWYTCVINFVLNMLY